MLAALLQPPSWRQTRKSLEQPSQSTSGSPSLPPVGGLENDLREVVRVAWSGGFTVQSDFARRYAVHVARAASCGYITTLALNGYDFGSKWYATRAGMALLEGRS